MSLTLEYSTKSLMNVLSIVAFHNNVVSVVYDEIIFHAELNINVVGIVRVENVSAQSA